MEGNIVQLLHNQWLKRKDEAVILCEKAYKNDVADRYRDCSLFKGTENISELISLYKSTQGIEFCTRYHFPELSIIRQFKNCDLEKYGVYLDAGKVNIKNPKGTVLLIGNTDAVIECSDTHRFVISCLHEASVTVYASGYAVVSIEAEKGCKIVKNIKDNAKIL